MLLTRSPVALVVAGVLLTVFMNSSTEQKTARVAKGLWGGQHISIDVGAESATIEYDCAHGEIQGPLVIDGNGKFELRGTFTPERGGPVRAGDSKRSQPATYTGVVKGNEMTLTLKVSDSDESETFTLEKGKAGDLFKCK